VVLHVSLPLLSILSLPLPYVARRASCGERWTLLPATGAADDMGVVALGRRQDGGGGSNVRTGPLGECDVDDREEVEEMGADGGSRALPPGKNVDAGGCLAAPAGRRTGLWSYMAQGRPTRCRATKRRPGPQRRQWVEAAAG
jgi:hypothetical protein